MFNKLINLKMNNIIILLSQQLSLIDPIKQLTLGYKLSKCGFDY